MKDLVERRKHKRFQVEDGAFALFRPHWHHSTISGRIIDISRDGLAFLYITSKDGSNGSFELSILFAYHSFYCDNVPVKTISDFEVADETPVSSITTRRRGVQFGELTQDQISQLEYFIQNHTIGERE